MDTLTPQSDRGNPKVPDPALARPSSDERPADVGSPSPQPTPQGPSDTAARTDPALTNSFHGTIATEPDEELAGPMPLPLGSMVEGYELLAQIGRGGMGIVFKARQPGTGLLVAVKMIRQGILAEAETVERFLREIAGLGRAQDVPNVVPIYHVGRRDGEVFFVMPFYAAGNLGVNAARLRTDPAKAVAIVEKIARAVHRLHLKEILHRDIKPANILLDAFDEPLLGDFGLIKLLDAERSLTVSDQILGTPPYMAPEQTGLVPTPLSERTDVWALGVVLFELLTGERPFKGSDRKDVSKLFWKIVHEAPPAPRSLRPDLDRRLEAVILKCIQKEPADRYGSADELADELARWLRGEAMLTRPATWIRRAVRWTRKNRWRSLAAALFLVGATVVPLVTRPPDPEAALLQCKQLLAAGKPVTVIQEKQPPAWSKILTPGDGDVSLDSQGMYTVESNRFSIVELMRDIPAGHYRVNARLRQNSSHLEGLAAIFVSYRGTEFDSGKGHFMYLLGYNDIIDARIRPQQIVPLPPNVPPVPPLPGNHADFRSLFVTTDGRPKPGVRSLSPLSGFVFQAAGTSGGIWRDLAVEIDAAKIIISFDREQPQEISIATCNEQANTDIKNARFDPRFEWVLANAPYQFDPRGSVGVAIRKGSVSVSNVVITPLD